LSPFSTKAYNKDIQFGGSYLIGAIAFKLTFGNTHATKGGGHLVYFFATSFSFGVGG
jgi:hypothetical protein